MCIHMRFIADNMTALDIDLSTYIDDSTASESEISMRYKTCENATKAPIHQCRHRQSINSVHKKYSPSDPVEVKKELSSDSGWGSGVTPSTKIDGEACKALVDIDSASNGEPGARRTPNTSSPVTPINPSQIITLNVAGMRFQTLVETLERYPDTLLGNANKRRCFYNVQANEYFFDRHRATFEAILYFYQSSGRLKRPENVPVDVFVKEMKFFEMGREVMEDFWATEGYRKPKERILPTNRIQRAVWQLVEHPDSSLSARIMAFFSVFVIILSTLSFCLETIPELRDYFIKNSTSKIHAVNGSSISSGGGPSRAAENCTTTNFTTIGGGNEYGDGDGGAISTTTPKSTVAAEIEFGNPFFIVEFGCICWFTLEFTLRFLSCPTKLQFCKSFLNIIDFVAIVPFFVNLAVNEEGGQSGGGSMSFAVLRVFRLVRVFRIFKLSRHSRGLQILGKTFKASVQELCLLMFFMAIGLVLFSSAVYFAEQNIEGTNFTSIPAAFWFSIVTMTTVGYGDLTPTGVYGKLVGSMCAIVGVLVLALPVPVIVANFKHFYRQETRLANMRALETGEDTIADDADSRSS